MGCGWSWMGGLGNVVNLHGARCNGVLGTGKEGHNEGWQGNYSGSLR